MITAIVYICAKVLFGEDWCEGVMVLPALMDLVLIGKVGNIGLR